MTRPVDSRRMVLLAMAGCLVLAIAIGFVLQVRAWSFISDDAFISFRYAENLAHHGELVFNRGERVEGYTNFLWVLLLAGGSAAGIEPPKLAPFLTVSASGATLVLAVLWLRALRRASPSNGNRDALGELVPAALLVAVPEFMVWAHGGLETASATACTVGASLAWTRRSYRLFGACTAAAALLRLDAVLAIVVYVTASFALQALRGGHENPLRVGEEQGELRRIAVGLAIAIFPVLLHVVWRRSYYGAWLPNTWTVKAHGALLRDTYGRAYLEAWVDATHLLWLVPLVVLLRPRHIPLVLMIASVLVYGAAVGGDFMAYGRFYLTSTTALAVLVGWLLADARSLLLARHRSRLASLPAVAGLGMAVFSSTETVSRWHADRAKPSGWLDGRWEGVTAMDTFAATGLRAGAWMREHLPPDTTISVGAAGAVPYASGLPTLDAYGLVDPVIPKIATPLTGRSARPGHQLWAPLSYVEQRDPDLLCHVGYRGVRRPSPGHAHPAFRRGYAWACIDVGTAQAPGFYCCRRPQGRLEDAFAEAPR